MVLFTQDPSDITVCIEAADYFTTCTTRIMSNFSPIDTPFFILVLKTNKKQQKTTYLSYRNIKQGKRLFVIRTSTGRVIYLRAETGGR